MANRDTWMGKAFGKHPGALHKQLGYSSHEEIPPGLVREIAEAPVGNRVRGRTVTLLLKRRAVAANNARNR